MTEINATARQAPKLRTAEDVVRLFYKTSGGQK